MGSAISAIIAIVSLVAVGALVFVGAKIVVALRSGPYKNATLAQSGKLLQLIIANKDKLKKEEYVVLKELPNTIWQVWKFKDDYWQCEWQPPTVNPTLPTGGPWGPGTYERLSKKQVAKILKPDPGK